MDKKTCNMHKDVNCYFCKDAVLVEPRGFDSFIDVVGVWGLFDALCIAEVVCPYQLLLDELMNKER